MSRALDFGHLVDLCRRTHEETQRSAARAADTYLVTRNWLFGWYIVEYEQRGADRAKYGARLLAKVSRRLQEAGIKGCSTTHLKLCRQFHQQQRRIGQTLSDQLVSTMPEGRISAIGQTPPDQFVSLLATLSRPLEEVIALLDGRFTLGWSHYVTLLTIDNADARRFYAVVELTLPQDVNIYAWQYRLYPPWKQESKVQLESIQGELGGYRETATDG